MKDWAHWLLWICLPVFNTLNQVAMKLTSQVVKAQDFGMAWLSQAISCPYLWMSFACEIVNFAVWLAILKRHHLSEAFPLTAVSYATLMLTSWCFFHEPVMLRQVVGVAIIVTGIAMLGLSKEKEGKDKSGIM